MNTLPETYMETQKGPYKDYSPFKKGLIWVSMLVWGSVATTGTTGVPRVNLKGWVMLFAHPRLGLKINGLVPATRFWANPYLNPKKYVKY